MNSNYCTTGGCDCGPVRPQPCQPCGVQNCQPCAVQPCQQETAVRCSCADDFRNLLGFLCSRQLQDVVDFTAFGFITDSFVLGTTLVDPAPGTAPGDNLTALTGTYVCGSAGCDAVAASGAVAYAIPGAPPVALPVTQVALCRLDAIALTVTGGEEGVAANFQTLTQTLAQLLEPGRPTCCSGTVAGSLLDAAAARSATVTAGPLTVFNAVVLGTLGEVLVLANSTDSRVYFVCADKIAFIG